MHSRERSPRSGTIASAVAYLDASAIVKLVLAEPESADLTRRLRDESRLATSELALAEAPRAIRRSTAADPAAIGPLLAELGEVLRRFTLLDLDTRVLAAAGRLGDPLLTTLDAIHVATALRLDDRRTRFLSYDARQLAAAERAGLATASPGAA